MSPHSALTLATLVLIGAGTVLVCLIGAWSIHRDLSSLWMELDTEMSALRLLTEDMWRDMLAMGAGTSANRQRRQAYAAYSTVSIARKQRRIGTHHVSSGPLFVGARSTENCHCQAQNNCPAGTAGPSGEPGVAGREGIPGKDGVPGYPAPDRRNAAFKRCVQCPAGRQGAYGEAGTPGLPGMRGRNGRPGYPGRDGLPGEIGEPGGDGAEGAIGRIGRQGEKGKDSKKPIGYKGLRGPPGPTGTKGPTGDHGVPAIPGAPGGPGEIGTPGPQGADGSDGEAGPRGQRGPTGKDSDYCPCPQRDGEYPNIDYPKKPPALPANRRRGGDAYAKRIRIA